MAVLVNVVGRFDSRDIDKARRALDDLGRQAGGPTATRLRGLGVVAAAAGAAIAVRFGVQSVKAFAEAEASQARLTAAFAKFPALADTNIEALRRLNTELQTKTRFDDDQTAAAQATLAQFKLTGTQIAELTPLLQDYASATGQEVVPAAESLGKAFLGNTKALKSIGINFKATGDTAKDFTTITAALRQQVGGLAETEGKTAQGQLAILNNTFGDLQESVGEALVPALTGLVQVATPVVRIFGALPTPVRSTAIAVGVLGTAALIAGPKILALRREMAASGIAAGRMGTGMKSGAKAIGIASVALAVAQPLVSNIGDKMFGATVPADQLAESLGKIAAGDASARLGEFGGKLHSLGQEVEHLANPGISQRFEDFWGSVAGNGGGEGRNRVLAQLGEVDSAMAQMVSSGNAAAAATVFERFAKETTDAGGSIDELRALLPNYAAAQAQAKRETVASASAMDEATLAADRQKEGIARLKTAFTQLQGIFDKRAALRGWRDSMAGVGDAVKVASGQFTSTTPKGREFQSWLDGSLGSLATYAQSFTNPLSQQKAFADGLKEMRARLARMGLSDAEINKILKPFREVKNEAKAAGRQITHGLAEGMEANKADLLARSRALGKAAALAIKDGAEVKSPSRITIKVGEELVNGLTVGVLRKAGGAKKVIRDATRDALSAAETALSRFQERGRTALDFIDSVRGRIVDSGSVAGFQSVEGKTASAGDVTGSMRTRVAQAQQFAKDIAALRKLKLNNASLQEIISAGPVAGDEIAQALLKGGAGAISQVNSLEAQLNAAAGSIGDSAGLSQYGLTGAQARGLASVSVRVEKGAILVDARGATAKDAKAIEDAVDKATERLIRKLIREMRAGK